MFAKKLIMMIIMMLITASLMISGCSTTCGISDESSGKSTELTMKYKMIDGKPLKYKQTIVFDQAMDIRGSTINTRIDNSCTYSINSKSADANSFLLGVTIDSIAVKINSIKGDIVPDMSGVIGRSFDMSISDFGYEHDINGADQIKYELVPGSEQSISSTFQNAFPNLARKPLKMGDSWFTVDTVIETTSKGTLILIFENSNKLIGYEKLNGLKCAKILTAVKGILDGKSTEQGMIFLFDGTIEGTDTWYFAPEEGILVKLISKGVGTGVTKAMEREEIVIPTTREFTMTTELIN